jgi:hypothetical protein
MSENNLTEKISDAVINVFKKTNFVEQFRNMKFYFGSFVMVTSLVGISGLLMHYFNTEQITKNQEEINSLREDILTYNKSILISIKELCLEEKIDNLEKKLVNSLEKQLYTLNEIKNLPLLSIGKIDRLSRNTSISSISLETSLPKKVNSINSDEGWQISEQENKNKEEDNDFLNECYDTLPLNNVKKVTGIKGWFA